MLFPLGISMLTKNIAKLTTKQQLSNNSSDCNNCIGLQLTTNLINKYINLQIIIIYLEIKLWTFICFYKKYIYICINTEIYVDKHGLYQQNLYIVIYQL